MTRRTFHVYADDAAAAELDAISAAGGSMSRYVCDLVKRAAQEWKEAMAYLDQDHVVMDPAMMRRFVARYRLVIGNVDRGVLHAMSVNTPTEEEAFAWSILAGEYRINPVCRAAFPPHRLPRRHQPIDSAGDDCAGMSYIRETYRVPAEIGGRVVYTGGEKPRCGTITGADGCYLRIRLDDTNRTMSYHPTWELSYQEASDASV